MSHDSHTYRIALGIEQDTTFGRLMVNGIISFVRKRPRWEIEIRGEHAYLSPQELLDWDGDGIIAQIYDEQIAIDLAKRNIPVINTASLGFTQIFPTVSVDNYRLGELAAEHLAGKGLKKFAYFQMENLGFAGVRFRGFSETLRNLGHQAELYKIPPLPGKGRMYPDSYREILETLERPVGIFAFNDRMGFGILKACREMKLSVPDDVALVSVDNDETLCILSFPQMTSIDPAAAEIGYRAAEMLDDILNGKSVPREPVLISPESLIVRESSDILEGVDPLVAEALRYIRNHDSESIQVADVVEALPVGRRSLERRFRECMGCSVYDEIRRTRIERAKQQLRETDMAVSSIARASGFNSIQRFEASFRQLVGMPASAYRKSQR